ncbi:hypothetical protein B0H13DRAFT_1924731 [Mycena leptocephala]|nr:hypothetical protein B0H13DRAFT_1924731 [Mycena leptocephala]
MYPAFRMTYEKRISAVNNNKRKPEKRNQAPHRLPLCLDPRLILCIRTLRPKSTAPHWPSAPRAHAPVRAGRTPAVASVVEMADEVEERSGRRRATACGIEADGSQGHGMTGGRVQGAESSNQVYYIETKADRADGAHEKEETSIGDGVDVRKESVQNINGKSSPHPAAQVVFSTPYEAAFSTKAQTRISGRSSGIGGGVSAKKSARRFTNGNAKKDSGERDWEQGDTDDGEGGKDDIRQRAMEPGGEGHDTATRMDGEMRCKRRRGCCERERKDGRGKPDVDTGVRGGRAVGY